MVIALDIGSSSARATLYDARGRAVEGRFHQVPYAATTTPDRTEAAVVALTARLTESIERAIRESPEQWVWMHRRWRRQPDGTMLR